MPDPIVTWIFLITFALPSFGGPVLIRFELTDESACKVVRRIAIQQLAEHRSNAVVSECERLFRP